MLCRLNHVLVFKSCFVPFPFVSRLFIAFARIFARSRCSSCPWKQKIVFRFLDEHLKNKTGGKIRLLSAVWHFTHYTDTSPGGSSSIQSCGAFSFFRNF